MGRALIVSAGASSNEYISARLTELGYARPIIVPSAAEARRRMLESDFELIVVNSPLPDEFGHELCADAVEKTDAGVIFLAKAAAAYGDVAKNIQIPESMQRMMDKMSVEATLKQMGKLVTPAFVHELNAALNQVKKEG